MNIDFHTHGKLAKTLPFSKEYTKNLFVQAKNSGLDALCLTEHFNTLEFETLYQYITSQSQRDGDTLIYNGMRIFPGMETDISEGGHILSFGPIEAILELNQRLVPYKKAEDFLPFEKLIELFSDYPVVVGAGHPFREGSHIPQLTPDLLEKFDFIDLNGKDLGGNRSEIESLTYAFAEKLGKPVIGGSDTHQTLQYGCIKTVFDCNYNNSQKLLEDIILRKYKIEISKNIETLVKAAGLLKCALKKIHALGGDYVNVFG